MMPFAAEETISSGWTGSVHSDVHHDLAAPQLEGVHEQACRRDRGRIIHKTFEAERVLALRPHR